MILAIWAYRNFIISSVKSEFKSRFAGSSIGGMWIIVHPLVQVAIYAFILSSVLSAKLPGINNKYAYSIYLMAGMLGWTLFSEIVLRSMNIFIENANLLKKMVFPKISLPIIVVISSLINHLLLFASVLLIFVLIGHYPTSALFWLIPLTAVVVAFAIGIGLILGIINVFIRDIGQVVPVVLQFTFWFTPIVYMPSIIPAEYVKLLYCNPLYYIITAYQEILLYGRPPELFWLVIIGCSALILMWGALALFRRANAEMMDIL